MRALMMRSEKARKPLLWKLASLVPALAVLALSGTSDASECPAYGAGDQFACYVEQVIPLGYELAQTNADLSEGLVFFKAASDLQEATAAASDFGVLIERYAPLLADLKSLPAAGTPESQEPAARQRTMQGLVSLEGMIQAADDMKARAGSRRALLEDFSASCSYGFESYRVADLPLQFSDSNVGLLDGVYMEISMAAGGFINPWMTAVAAALTLWQVWLNSEDIAKINAAKDRLQREGVNDEAYRSFAREACLRHQADYRAQMDSYASSLDKLQLALKAINLESVRAARDLLRARVDGFVEETRRRILGQARDTVDRRLQPEREHLSESSRTIRSNLALQQALFHLRKTPCGAGAEWLERIQSEAGAARFFALPNIPLLDRAEKAVQERAIACGGTHR
jgi:hypothetical protein